MASYNQDDYWVSGSEISALKKQLAEKDAMIDWLAKYIGRHECVKGEPDVTFCQNDEACKNCWREAARKAVSESNSV